MKTQRQQAEERHAERLVAVQEQIDAGTLTIRKMTAKERTDHPPQPRPEHGRGSWRTYRWAH
jgi:hypothetical protein